MKRFTFLSLLLALPFWARAQAPTCSPSLPQDVCAVEQQIYLETDFHKTADVERDMISLKNLAMKYNIGSPTIFKHILELAEKVAEEAHAVRSPRQLLSSINGKSN